MPTFTNLKDAVDYVKNTTKNIVKTEVAEIVKEEESEVIKTTVLGVYEPTIYERRKSGGIDDVANMKDYYEESADSISLTIQNETPPTDGYPNVVDNLAGMIEYGDNKGYGNYGYTRNMGGEAYGSVTAYLYLEDRPFEEITKEHLEETGIVNKAVGNLLKRKGINTK